ncbi:MAG: hypothetical protein ACERKD_10840 [Prolixibacteraceae bacterium]
MKFFSFIMMACIFTMVVNAQTTIDISALDAAYTKTVDDVLVIDVATASSTIAAPKLGFANPFKGVSFTEAEISFDVNNYHGVDSIKVLGALMSIFDPALGRLYFTNGSYLGYNDGQFFDANLISYAVGTDFIGGNTWKSIKLQFTATGYAMYVDGTLAFDQSSTNVTIAGDLTDYGKLIAFLQNAETFAIGAGSWWSDNTRPDGTYWDAQFSYLKNIKFTPNFSSATAVNQLGLDDNGEVISEDFYSITGIKVAGRFQDLKPGVYIKMAKFSNGVVKSTKVGKIQ